MNLHSSAPLVPKTSTLHTSPRGKRLPSETSAVVPPDSPAIACALSGSPGNGSIATPDPSAVIETISCWTSQRVWSNSCTPMSTKMPPLRARNVTPGGSPSHWKFATA